MQVQLAVKGQEDKILQTPPPVKTQSRDLSNPNHDSDVLVDDANGHRGSGQQVSPVVIMAHLPSHRSTTSLSQSNLQPLNAGPTPKQQRRMTSPASNASLSAPEVQRPQGRPPSPLRNEFIPDTFTGIHPEDFSDEEDDENYEDRRQWTERSPSPSSSVSQLAASLTQRVGNFLGGITPRSPGSMPTDAELEAEAERERDRSRREAERILTREAEERKLVEERVLAIMSSTRSLPPPPSHSDPTSSSSSPSGSQKESSGNWWTAAKNKLTPTKEKDPPTPAQQVMLEAKARDKDKKGKGKEKEKKEPFMESFTNDSVLNLNIPNPPLHRKPVPPSPSSPTPSRPSMSNMAPNLSPSPMRSIDVASSSPSREAPLLYTQFNPQGTLDVPGTLLTIAKRFEKLEKWTVGHVRALEDRMSDVERWLVDKEKEKEKEKSEFDASSTHPTSPEILREIQDTKDGLTELQGRVGSLGREMAKLATAPSNLSSGPSRQTGSISIAPHTTSTHIVHDTHGSGSASPPPPSPLTTTIMTPQHSRLSTGTARESTSPPMATASSKASGTRLPYPTGDYATPPDSALIPQQTQSPPHSPPSSSAPKIRPLTVSGLGMGLGILSTASNSSLASNTCAASPQPARAMSPPVPASAPSPAQAQAQTQAQAHGLPPPKRPSPRPTSVSPTPRKRYTVALGEPIMSSPDREIRRGSSPRPMLSSSPAASTTDDDGKDTVDEGEFDDETIGKSASARFVSVQPANGDYKDYKSSVSATSEPSPASKRRLRAQSAYGFAAVQQLQAPVTPLRPKMRSRSTERLVSGGAGAPGPEHSFPTGKFVDPLVLRRQGQGKKEGAPTKPAGKVPVGQLVAFFDGEKGR